MKSIAGAPEIQRTNFNFSKQPMEQPQLKQSYFGDRFAERQPTESNHSTGTEAKLKQVHISYLIGSQTKTCPNTGKPIL